MLCFNSISFKLQSGYRDVLKLADNFSAFNQRLKYAHFRPLVPVRSDPRSWWKYAYRVVSDQMKKARYSLLPVVFHYCISFNDKLLAHYCPFWAQPPGWLATYVLLGRSPVGCIVLIESFEKSSKSSFKFIWVKSSAYLVLFEI